MADVLAIHVFFNILFGLGHAAVVHHVLALSKVGVDYTYEFLRQGPKLFFSLWQLALFHWLDINSFTFFEVVWRLK